MHEPDETRGEREHSQTKDRLQRLGSLPGITIEVAGTTRCKIIGPPWWTKLELTRDLRIFRQPRNTFAQFAKARSTTQTATFDSGIGVHDVLIDIRDFFR
ncbi:hypothetical protein CEE69_15410 [Rhodopirellula bahusiensis]|uniref:Uncharacterized protein n=1 Tax=Rhodopirellula bahusiensis TaxID=2014065 RepID=A0A2G1W6X1_9BACT|nr:hypothetical protein CEE69_15410 [Rhodopirellula bahusiensis]